MSRFALFYCNTNIIVEIGVGALFFVPPLTEMFHFSGLAPSTITGTRLFGITQIGFPHSEITGSKVASHLPDAYRRHATSFITVISQGIHHSLITYFLLPCSEHEVFYYCGCVSNRYRFYVSLFPYNLFFSCS